jgi:hypothetical protein
MQKKHTHNCRNLARTRKKTTGVPSCCSEQDSRVAFLLQNPPQMLTAASSSSESPTANTFRMPQKNTHTHNCRTPGTRKKNTTHTPSCLLPSSSESPTTNTFRMPKEKKHPPLQNSRDKGKKKTQYTPSYFPQFIKKYLKAKEEL